MKKVISFIMALVMTVAVFCAVPFTESPFKITAEAALSGKCGNNLTWTLSDSGTLTISGTGPMTNYNAENTAPWYGSRAKIKSVVFNEGITNIGSFAFYLCTNLTSVSFAKSVTAIYARAFYNCSNLGSVSLPANLLSVGNYTFGNCDKLISVIFPDTVTLIGEGAFKYCDQLSFVALGNKIKTIASYAFNACDKLINVYYAGSASDWEKIDFGLYNSSLDGANQHYNVPTELAVCHYGCGTVTTLPSGSSLGISTYTCACGHSYTKTTNCTGHNYTNQTTVRVPTCTKYGMVRKNCSGCGEAVYLSSKPLVINPDRYPESPHDYYSNMSQTYTFYQKGVYKLVLKFSDETYTEPGYDYIYIYNASGSLVGTYDGYELSGKTIELSGDHFSIKITSDGSVTKYGFSFSEIIAYQINTNVDPLGHSYSSAWTIDTASTCTQKGTKSHHCVRCNNRTDVTTLPLDDKNHDFSTSWTIDSSATCISEGSKSRHCTRCSVKTDVTVIPINTNNHSFSSSWTIDIPSTCKSNGSKSHHCTRCDKKTDITVIEPKPHQFSGWEVIKSATYTSLGQKVRTCSVCQTTEYAVIPMFKCAPPKLSTATNESSGVKITWKTVTGAQTYRVFRKTTYGKWSMIVKDLKTTYYIDKTAKGGTSYKYTVRAHSGGGLSDYDTKGVAIRRLSTPTLQTATSTKSGISLKWNKITGAQGYIIYRKTGSGSYTKLVTEKGISNLSYVDKTAKKGKKYTYKVRAYYNTSYSAYSGGKAVTDKY